MTKVEDYDTQVNRDDLADAVKHTPKKIGVPRIERLRTIVRERQCARVEGLLVDGFTASMLVQLHDVMNPTQQAKFLALSLRKMVAVGWKLARPAK